MAIDILINGQATNTLPVDDRGLQYGDGLFETIAIKNGKLLCWDSHLERLVISCRLLQIPFTDLIALRQEVELLADKHELAVLKIIITRGQGGRGYTPPANPVPSRILATYPWPEYPTAIREEGVATIICNSRYAINPLLAGMKHLNRLEQVMARMECEELSIREGIMLDINNAVIEGTMSNIFIIKNKQIMTPELSQCGVKGVIRKYIIDTHDVLIKSINIDDLMQSDEIFLCNSIMGVWPVTKLNDKQFKIGALTKLITQLFIKQGYIV